MVYCIPAQPPFSMASRRPSPGAANFLSRRLLSSCTASLVRVIIAFRKFKIASLEGVAEDNSESAASPTFLSLNAKD